jgi:hypothetical protein
LVVDPRGRLLTCVERGDVPAAVSGSAAATDFGTLAGRTVDPSVPLQEATAALVSSGRRRLAVVDGRGRLLGLLCRKRRGHGYCSDAGIRARADERRGERYPGGAPPSPCEDPAPAQPPLHSSAPVRGLRPEAVPTVDEGGSGCPSRARPDVTVTGPPVLIPK